MHTLFEDRFEAGRRLAARLAAFSGTDSVVLAIPRGGLPVASEVARVLGLPWCIIVSKKLPVPWADGTSFGAVADGAVVLNEAMVHGLGLHKEMIKSIVDASSGEAERCSQAYALRRPPVEVSGKNAIVVDDGIASGYTMMAAIKQLRSENASKIVAASPVASRFGSALVSECADECVFEIVSPAVPFAISDFYLARHELSDGEVLEIMGSS